MDNYAEQLLTSITREEYFVSEFRCRLERAVQAAAPAGLNSIDYSDPVISSYTSSADLLSKTILSLKRKLEEHEQQLERINRAIAGLTKTYGEVVKLWYIEHRTKEYIAEALHVSIPTVYSYRSKALREFAIIYKELEDK